jgi:hypothetical protein
MNKDVISFIPANFGSFVGLDLAFTALGFLIYALLQYPSWCLQQVRPLAGQRCWQGMISRRKPQEDVEQPLD